MDELSDYAVVAQGDMQHLREIQRALKARGMAAQMMQPPGGCGSS